MSNTPTTLKDALALLAHEKCVNNARENELLAKLEAIKKRKIDELICLEKRQCVNDGIIQVHENILNSNSLLTVNQSVDVDFVKSKTFFQFIDGFSSVPTTIIANCHETFKKNNTVVSEYQNQKKSKEAAQSSLFQYFQNMFCQIISVLEAHPQYSQIINDFEFAHLEALAPFNCIPDFHLRCKRERYAWLLSVFLHIEVQNSEDYMAQGLSNSIKISNAVIGEFIKCLECHCADTEDYLRMSIVSLVVTPESLTAVRVFARKVDGKYGREMWKLAQESTRTAAHEEPLLLHGPDGTHGPGFSLLVNALALGADRLHCWRKDRKRWVLLNHGTKLKLISRVGRGGSSDTYEGADQSIVKIRHMDTVALKDEGAVLRHLNRKSTCEGDREPPHIPLLLSYSADYIQMEPCGVPLTVLIASLFAHRKLSVRSDPTDCTPAAAINSSMVHSNTGEGRPVGLLVLAYLVLRDVSLALRLAHSTTDNNQTSYIHSDLRIGNIVLAMWSPGTVTTSKGFVRQPSVVVSSVVTAAKPSFNTAVLVDWGNALQIGVPTANLPGSLEYAADEVLELELSMLPSVNKKKWTPAARNDWESLAYLYWSIASPVLAECPWLGEDELRVRRKALLKHGKTKFERSVWRMVKCARDGRTDLMACVDMVAVAEDYDAMAKDPTIPFCIPGIGQILSGV